MKYIILLLSFVISTTTWAAAKVDPQQAIRASVETAMPGAPIDEISATPVPGIYQVVSGSDIVYVSADGRYFIEGELYRLEDDHQFTSLTAERRQTIIQKALSKIAETDYITFAAAKHKAAITIFTDIDCGYCRALHKEVPALNEAGITVRYLAFPRSAPGSESFKKAEHVWCAADKKAAYAKAIAGETPVVANCENPVLREQTLGRELGINVTPVIILQDGTLIPGYLPAAELIKLVEQRT